MRRGEEAKKARDRSCRCGPTGEQAHPARGSTLNYRSITTITIRYFDEDFRAAFLAADCLEELDNFTLFGDDVLVRRTC